jgi:hypothetical protein
VAGVVAEVPAADARRLVVGARAWAAFDVAHLID